MNSCRTRFVNCLSLQDAALARRLHLSILSGRSFTSWGNPNEPPQERTAGGKVGMVDLTTAGSFSCRRLFLWVQVETKVGSGSAVGAVCNRGLQKRRRHNPKRRGGRTTPVCGAREARESAQH